MESNSDNFHLGSNVDVMKCVKVKGETVVIYSISLLHKMADGDIFFSSKVGNDLK